MTVSVIVPTIHANDQMLETCVERVQEHHPDVELLVEDDGGSFAVQCNRGAEKATGNILVFLNDDTEVQAGWLEPLIDPIVRDPTVGVTGAKLVYPDGTIQHAGVYLGIEDGLLTARNVCWNAASGPVQAVTGACLAVRRDVFEALEGFDAGYVNGYEDVDLCLRVAQMGFGLVYVAESMVIHHESQSGPLRWAHVSENVARLQELWVADASGVGGNSTGT